MINPTGRKAGQGRGQGHRRGPAYRVFSKAAKENPKGWEALEQMALYNMERMRMRVAFRQARSALANNNDAPYALLVSGAWWDERGQDARAKGYYRRFLKLCPKCRFVGEIRRRVR